MSNDVNGVAEQLDKLKIDKSGSGCPALIEDDGTSDLSISRVAEQLDKIDKSGEGDGTIDFRTFRMPFRKMTCLTDLQESLLALNSALAKYGYSCALDLDQYKIIFSATKTMGRNAIVKAACLIQLLSSEVPARRALKVLSLPWDIIYTGYHIGALCSTFGIKHDKYMIRKKMLMRLPVQELEQLIGCDVHLCRSSDLVAAVGPIQGLKLVRRIVEDCIVKGVPPAPRVKGLTTYARAIKGIEALKL